MAIVTRSAGEPALRTLKLPYVPNAPGRFSPNGSLLATRQPAGHFGVFDLTQGKEVLRVQTRPAAGGPVGFTSSGQPLAFSPDGGTLAVVSEAGAIEAFDSATGARRFEWKIPLDSVHDVRISPDGRNLFCTAHSRDWILVRDWEGKKEVIRLNRNAPEPGLAWSAFSPDGLHIAIGHHNTFVALYDVRTGNEVRRFATEGNFSRPAFSWDGRRLLAGNSIGAISQWDVETGKPVGAVADPLAGIQVVRFAERGKHLLVDTDRPELWDWKAGRVVHRYQPPALHGAFRASLSPDSGLMTAYKSGGVLLLFDANTGAKFGLLGSQNDPVRACRFAPTGKALFTAIGPWVHVWALPKLELVRSELELIRKLKPSTEPGAIDVSPDGKWLATAPIRNENAADVQVWDVASGALVRSFTPRLGTVSGIGFAPDGKDLAIATGAPGSVRNHRVILVNVETGREKRVIANLDYDVYRFHFSADGRSLAVIELNGGPPLRMWEVATGMERHTFAGHTNPIVSLAFSDDSALLASSSQEAPAYVWDIYGRFTSNGPDRPLAAEDGKGLWKDLASPDARAGFQAIRRLVRSPGPGVELLGQHLRRAAPPDPERVKQRLLDLDSDDYETRQAAYTELEELDSLVEEELKAGLEQPPSLEFARRVETLLTKLDRPNPDRVRETRAVEALEQIATPEAVALLERLAGGAPGARRTREAAATLERVRKR
jgi:WD40 repeat protein